MTIQLNENNYVVGFSTANTMKGVEYNGEYSDFFLENSMYYKYENEELIFDEEKYNEEMARTEAIKAKNAEISEIKAWFVEYDMQVIQYMRSVALEEDFDKDIMELHTIAKEKAIRLKELEG